MSPDSFLQLISTGKATEDLEPGLAFAEVSGSGTVVRLNAIACLAWGFRIGSRLPADLQIALECLEMESPSELPVTIGGLHIRGIARSDSDGWFMIGYEPDNRLGDPFGLVRQRTWVDKTESVKHTLRELATVSPDPRIFRDAAVAALGEAAGASRASLMGLSVSKDRLVEIAAWTRNEEIHTPESITREDLSVIELAGTGRLLQYSQRDGAGICGRFDADFCWVAPIHDNTQFAGYLVIAWSEPEMDELIIMPSRMESLTQLFESLYSWIQLGERYRMTVASIDDALFGFSFYRDGTRKYYFATDQFAMLSGYQPFRLMEEGELRINWVRDIVHADDASSVRAHDMTLRDGHESRVTYRIHHRDGSIRWLREHATPRNDSTGMTAVNGIISDVSEQKAAELVLLQAKKEAEASDRSKTAFIARLSHEIRTPLGAVNGFAQLLQKELEEFEEGLSSDLPEQVHEFISAISERAQKLQNLVHDLFELSNLEMGKVVIQKSRVSVPSVVRAAVEKARSAAIRKGLNLELSVHGGEGYVLGDNRRLGLVFDNLLSNAVKFTDHGVISVQVRVTHETVMVEVCDTGIGISDNYRDHLFDTFSQEEDWRNRRYEGVGLGLSLVKRLLELMNGRIEVESEKGSGSIFRVSLPAMDPYQALAAPRSGWRSERSS